MRKVRLLFTLLVSLCLVLVIFVFDKTISRYIRQERDEIYATYTDLYFESNIQGGTAVLENKTALLTFELKNYSEDNITKREIIYSIGKPNYIDENGHPLALNESGELVNSDNTLYQNDKLYVKDVWGSPKEIQKDSYKYDIKVKENSATDIRNEGSNISYVFPYKNGTEGTAATHNLVVELERTHSSEIINEENISIVVQLSSPYSEVLIINVRIVKTLISYNALEITKFDTKFQSLGFQTANIFAYEDGTNKRRTVEINGKTYRFTSNSFRITIDAEGMFANWLNLDNLHVDIYNPAHSHMPDNNPDNHESSANDISKNYLDTVTNTYDSATGKYLSQIKIYAPQASEFSIDFLQRSQDYNLKLLIEVCLEEIDETGNPVTGEEVWMTYNSSCNGYAELDNGSYALIESANSGN